MKSVDLNIETSARAFDVFLNTNLHRICGLEPLCYIICSGTVTHTVWYVHYSDILLF